MAVDVELQDEEGKTLLRYDGPPLTARILEAVPRASVCLRFIDPAGDTTFNQLQIAVLTEELEQWANQNPAPAIRHLLNFVTGARYKTHSYVKFIGD